MAVIITQKQYFISTSETKTKVFLPKNVKNEAGVSIMVGRKKLLNPAKVGKPSFKSVIKKVLYAYLNLERENSPIRLSLQGSFISLFSQTPCVFGWNWSLAILIEAPFN